MNTTIVIFLLVLAISVITFLPKKRRGKSYYQPSLRPYISKSPLTLTETTFYHRLVEALPDYVILAQVQLSSFLKVDLSQTQGKNHYTWFNPISQQSVDFLICEKDFSIIAAVELDDKSHLDPEAIERDTKKSNNLDAANITLIRWHAEAMPEAETIKQTFLRYTSGLNSPAYTQPAWLADEPPSFISRNKKQNDSLLRALILGAASIGLIIWVFSGTKSNLTRLIAPLTNNSQPSLQTQPVSPSQQLQIRQQQAAQEASRIRAEQVQQALIKQQNIQKLMQDREVALKEDAWNHYNNYKKSVECSKVDGVVTCGNKIEKDRQQFEKYWAAQRSNLKR